MLLLQASIGAVNDLADVELDRVGKPGKPIPAGQVPLRVARGWAAGTGAAGLALTLPSGPATLLVAAVGVGLGYAYDVRLSRTALALLPLAIALPLVPIFAWLGTRGEVPSSLVTLLPVAFLAGSALQVANGLVDVDRDLRARRATVAVRIGRYRAWLVNVAVFSVAVGLAFLLAPGVSRPDAAPEAGGVVLLAVARTLGVPAGAFAIALGAGLLSAARAETRERGWELEAIGTAILGIGWLAGIAASEGAGLAA